MVLDLYSDVLRARTMVTKAEQWVGSANAQIEPPQNIEGWDFCYLRYAPGVCLAREEGAYVINLTGEHRLREEIADQAGKMILRDTRRPKICR